LKALLLSIKPEYVEKILQGEKKFEYRKRLAKEDVSYIYVYSTAPSMKVVASVHIEGHLSDSPTALWEKTKAAAGISRAKFRDYFRGCKTAYAYKLGKVEVFESPKNLSDFGVAVAPQSFVYIKIE
jgi:predicted transcriptional regulator